MRYKERILDALDVETFILAKDEGEAKGLLQGMLEDFGFSDHDIVFLEQVGPGVRVRARAYVHRPGAPYGWLAGGNNSGI